MNHVPIPRTAGIVLFLFIIAGAAFAESAWTLKSTTQYKQKATIAGFLDGKTGITAGYAGAVYYSTDGGETWPQARNSSWCRFGLEILDGKNAWTCGNQGHVRVSHDGGQTWQSTASFGEMEPHQCRYLSFSDAATGWIASAKRFAATIDGAKTWNEIPLTPDMTNIAAIHLLTRGKGFVLTSDGVLHVTRDGGKTWQAVKMNLNGNTLMRTVPSAPAAALRFSDEKRGMLVFLRTEKPRQWTVMRTADGGKAWKEESLPDTVASLGRGTVFINHEASIITINDPRKKMIYIIGCR